MYKCVKRMFIQVWHITKWRKTTICAIGIDTRNFKHLIKKLNKNEMEPMNNLKYAIKGL
jgi:hypothetical protein